MLIRQGNLAITYHQLGREEQSLNMRRDVYIGTLKLFGESHGQTLQEADNYAASLNYAKRFDEAKAFLRRVLPVARRVLGASHYNAFRMRWSYARALSFGPSATLDDLREAVNMLEDVERTARRVLGGAHPGVGTIEISLRDARAALRARETPPSSSPSGDV